MVLFGAALWKIMVTLPMAFLLSQSLYTRSTETKGLGQRFLIHYAAETGKDLSGEIEKVDEIIKYLEDYQEPIRVSANA